MISQGWFIEKVLNKNVVPNSEVCSQLPKIDREQNRDAKNRMDKGFMKSVPNVPSVPTEKESPCVLSGEDDDKAQDLEKIREWLYRIGEPEKDHHLVIDKCKTDPDEAMEYFLKHAQGEFDSHTVTDEQRADDRVKCSDCPIYSKEM